MRRVTNFDKLSKQIEMTITAEGLRIELLEGANGTFFELGDAKPSPSGRELLTALAQELSQLHNRISVEGHTDSKPYQGKNDYSNWELSVDRANAARRIMREAGVKDNQVEQVRGYADQHLRNKEDPMDPTNRRISVIVQYLEKDISIAPVPQAGGEASPRVSRPRNESLRGDERLWVTRLSDRQPISSSTVALANLFLLSARNCDQRGEYVFEVRPRRRLGMS